MDETLKINDDIKSLKLAVLKDNLKQNWKLDTDLWNEEFPHDFRFEDTYLQLSFVLRDFNIDELKHLISITNLFDVKNYSHDISTLINNYIKSCVDYLNHEIDGKTDEYFQKFNNNNNCFSYEKKIKKSLTKYQINYSLFFYGTLRSLEVRKAVNGESSDVHHVSLGYLLKHKVFRVKNANYPLIKYTNNQVDVVKGLMMLCLKVSTPFLLSAMIIGLIVSFFQAITSLQEQTLTFVPKALVVVAVVFILFPWLMNTMLDYTAETFNRMSQVGP